MNLYQARNKYIGIFLCSIFISGDLAALNSSLKRLVIKPIVYHFETSTEIGGNGQMLVENHTGGQGYLGMENTDTPTEESRYFEIPSHESIGYIGESERDPMNNPSDDIFQITIAPDILESGIDHLILEYKVYGVLEGANIPKAINGKWLQSSKELSKSSEWVVVRELVSTDLLHAGLNYIRFTLPSKYNRNASIKELRLISSSEMEANFYGTIGELQVLDKPILSDEDDNFILLECSELSSSQMLRYALNESEMPSVPNEIINVTAGASGYRLLGEGEGRVNIRIKYDRRKIPAGYSPTEIKTFYFDYKRKQWISLPSSENNNETNAIETETDDDTDYINGIIKAPEMPETMSYVPTQFSDMEAASPATGMNLMQPPGADPGGMANISCPLEIPAGRNGMQPSLSLNYSNSGNGGWIGVGWNIATSSIAVDSRWGVPRFDPDFETEGYAIDGAELVYYDNYQPHRASYFDSVGTNDYAYRDRDMSYVSNFFEKTTRGYKTIYRIGYDPTDYYWQVDNADGSTYFYGRYGHDTTFQNNVVLRDNNDNIVQWNLCLVKDKWGNETRYFYHNKTYSSTNDLIDGGRALLLDSIRYTGHNSSLGKYGIYFHTNDTVRLDQTASFRNGFHQVDAEWLDSVVVKYDGETVKKWRFVHDRGAFFKSILLRLEEYRSNALFYSHEFEYFALNKLYDGHGENDPDDTLFVSEDYMFSSIEAGSYILGHDYVAISGSEFGPLKRYSPLGTSLSRTQNVGGSLNFGLALPNSYDKSLTLGGNMNFGFDKSMTVAALDDVDGNGLPDTWIREEGQPLRYYPMAAISYDNRSFMTKEEMYTNRPPYYHYSNGHTTSFGTELVLGIKLGDFEGSFNVGMDWTDGTRETKIYTLDYNSDGMMDYVAQNPNNKDRYIVFFNTTNPITGAVTFHPSSFESHSPVIQGELVQHPVIEAPRMLTEVVKVWTAPVSATYNISGNAYLNDTLGGDGVRLGIQLNHNTWLEPFSTISSLGTWTASTDCSNCTGLNLTAGDQIFFRVRPLDSRIGDFLEWDPVITCNQSAIDPNLIDYYSTSASEGFLLSAEAAFPILSDTIDYTIYWPDLDFDTLSDDIHFEIRLFEDVYSSSPQNWTRTYHLFSSAHLLEETIPWGDTILTADTISGFSIPSIAHPNNAMGFEFIVHSSSNVDWKRVNWRPTVEYLGYTFHPVVQYKTYNKVLKHCPQTENLSSVVNPNVYYGTYLFSSNVSTTGLSANDSVWLVFKTDHTLLGKYKIKYNGTGFDYYPSTIQYFDSSMITDRRLSAEFFTDCEAFALALANCTTNLGAISNYDNGGSPLIIYEMDEICHSVFYMQGGSLMGPDYLYWGQFAWTDTTEALIDTSEFRFPEILDNPLNDYSPSEMDLNQYSSLSSTDKENFVEAVEEMQEIYNLRNFKFFPMAAKRKESYRSPLAVDCFVHYDDLIGVSEEMFRPGYIGEFYDDLDLSELDFTENDYSAYGIRRLDESKSASLSISLGGTFTDVASLNGSFTKSLFEDTRFSQGISTQMDLNGDGYPDAVLLDDPDIKVQFTNPWGAYLSQQTLIGIASPMTKTKNQSIAVGAGRGVHFRKETTKGTDGKRGKPNTGSVSDGGSASWLKNFTEITWMDVNGDGLPDRLERVGSDVVAYMNMGYGFSTTARTISGDLMDTISNTRGFSQSYNLGGNIGKYHDETSLSFAGGIRTGYTRNIDKQTFIDFNGDGLPDKIFHNGYSGNDFIAFNCGTHYKAYDPSENYRIGTYFGETQDNASTNAGFNLAFTVGFPVGGFFKACVNPQYSYGSNIDRNHLSYRDINGDGLPDLLVVLDTDNGSNPIVGDYNLKTILVWYNQAGLVNTLKSVTNPLGGGFDLSYELVGNKYGLHPREIVDSIHTPATQIYWDMPSARWVLSKLAIWDGHNLFTTSFVKLDGPDTLNTHFRYDGGLHSRRNKDFIHFTLVETIAPGGDLHQVVEYHSPNLDSLLYGNVWKQMMQFAHLKGLPKSSYTTTHGEGLKKSDFYYEMYPINTTSSTLRGTADVGSPLDKNDLIETQPIYTAMVRRESQRRYVDTAAHVHQREYLYSYDSLMNLVQYTDKGENLGSTADDIIAVIEYFTTAQAASISNMQKSHKVFIQSTANPWQRRTEVALTSSGPKAPGEIRRFLSDTDTAISTLSYDSYGNMLSLAGPKNLNDERAQVHIVYDSEVNSFPVMVYNHFNDTSRTSYHIATALVSETEDINGHKIKYYYDTMYRPERIVGPNEDNNQASDYTLRYQYFPKGKKPAGNWWERVPVALTYHYNPDHDTANAQYEAGISENFVANDSAYAWNSGTNQWEEQNATGTKSNALLTATFTDGLGRVVQVKKDISVVEGAANHEYRQVSGPVVHDHYGRPALQYLPISEAATTDILLYNRGLTSVPPVTVTYDYANRVIETRGPNDDGGTSPAIVSTMNYGWTQLSSVWHYVKIATDPDGRISKQYINARGQTVATAAMLSSTPVWTNFIFDHLGQLTATKSDDGEQTDYSYDRFGRPIVQEHPDRGTTTTTYDLAGNTTAVQTEVLSGTSQWINYDYHYNRPVAVHYPNTHAINNVYMEYGSRGDGHNGAGRLTRLMQGDSNHYVLVEEMYYDPLGNNTRHIRAIDVPFEGQRTFTTDHQYDSWGRVQRITYPDGETLRYHYSYGGELLRMYGHMPASDTVHYIHQLGYDQYGDRSYLRYGNGTETEYSYTPGTRRMANVRMQSSDINSQNIPITLLDKDFSYTPAGNVEEVSSTGDYFDEPYNTLGGSYTHHYTYDHLNRLTTATGEWEGHSSHTESYTLEMEYNTVGGITQKAQQHNSSINGSPATDYTLHYSYSTAQPHALDEVTDGTYTYVYSYDANGNMTQKTQDTDPIMAALWDEADRMRAVRNLNGISHYIYDANGQRLMKGGIDMDFASFDSQEMPGSGWVVKPYTIYVNPYLVFNGDGYVFDTSPDRFTKHYYAGSERVASRLNREGQSATEHTTNNIYSPTAAYAPVLVNLQAALTDFGLSPDLNADPAGYPPNPIEYEEDCQEQFSNDPIEIERCLCLHFPAEAALQSIECSSFEPVYWYHPDYLGHTDFVTDRTGQPYQHFFYAPFGEALLSQHTGTGYYNSPYRFNAKELDSETGLIYYGARYYEPKESVWLSVDRYHFKYPHLSNYSFSGNNPVLYYDVNGDTLEISLNADSERDLRSIIKPSNQGRIGINQNGAVSVHLNDLSIKEQKKLLNRDAGLSLINDLVNSNKKMLYESANISLFKVDGSLYDIPWDVILDDNGIINASNFGKDSNGGYKYRPQGNYDGQVSIAEGDFINDNGERNRNSVVFHELAEMYYRTHEGLDYSSKRGIGAHTKSNLREGSSFGNPSPGSAKYIRPEQTTIDTKIRGIIKQYYWDNGGF